MPGPAPGCGVPADGQAVALVCSNASRLSVVGTKSNPPPAASPVSGWDTFCSSGPGTSPTAQFQATAPVVRSIA